MLVKKEYRYEKTYKKVACDGKGEVEFVPFCPDGGLPLHCRFATTMIVPKGCSIGLHPHNDEKEIYYCISGEGITTENGEQVPFKPGDVTVVGMGEEHHLENVKDEPLVALGIIITVA